MKRIKIMLLAIAVVAVVGGALAFKAAKTPLAKVYTCSVNVPLNTTTCKVTFPEINPATTTNGAGQALVSGTITIANIAGLPCDNNVVDCTFPITATVE